MKVSGVNFHDIYNSNFVKDFQKIIVASGSQNSKRSI
jgi:hypothetical protein